MTDIVERLRRGEHWPQAAADEIERLRAEVETWVGHAKTAVWSDSEQCKLLTADNERLRAALLTGVLMLSEMGLDPREKCQMAYDYMSAALEDRT